MARYLFSSHDGYGLGHVRRNTLVAEAILAREPDAEITVVTGLAVRPTWMEAHRAAGRFTVVGVPPLVKDAGGTYRNGTMSFDDALALRSQVLCETVASRRPDVVVVDRHPYGVAGELRPALDLARADGAALVLGLRDVLDDASTVRAELAGAGWDDVDRVFDRVLVYGARHLCDHEAEYGLGVTPTYCGWVAERRPRRPRDPDLLVVTGGGGGDGQAVFDLGAAVSAALPTLKTVLVAGPYAADPLPDPVGGPRRRLRVVRNAPGCADLLSCAGAVLQMAGYNSTFEALAAGLRPILLPRRAPRREQAIRAHRLAALGLADVVDETSGLEEVLWHLRRPRTLPPGALDGAGLCLTGAGRAAREIAALVPARGRGAQSVLTPRGGLVPPSEGVLMTRGD